MLAATVGPAGSITGVDNAPPDYGGPFTVGQAQDFILRSSLGCRIAFQRDDTTRWLQSRCQEALSESTLASAKGINTPPASRTHSSTTTCRPSGLDDQPCGHLPDEIRPQLEAQQFDAAVFLHSLWYFPSGRAVRELLEQLAVAGVPRFYVAEWSGQPTSPAQEPHALAAEVQRRLYSLRSADYVARLDEQNIRGGALLPDELVAMAQEMGWSIAARGSMPTPLGIRDGYYEAQSILQRKFILDVESVVQDPVARSDLLASRDKIASMLRTLKAAGSEVESMDTIWLVFEM